MSRLLLASITNRAVDKAIGSGDGGQALGYTMGQLYRTAIMVGGLAVLLYLVWGGLNWITAGGDEKKVEQARNRITGAIIGMAALVATAAIAAFISSMFGFDLLNPSV